MHHLRPEEIVKEMHLKIVTGAVLLQLIMTDIAVGLSGIEDGLQK